MKAISGGSTAPEHVRQLVDALLLNFESQADFEKICQAVWPKASVYRGGTHIRLFPFGDDQISIYIDCQQ